MGDLENIDGYFNFVLPLVKKAGELFLESKNQTIEIENKTAHDLVTIYDKKIEETLIEKIRTQYPSHKFIGEESCDGSKDLPPLTHDPTWIIDPVDGTTNFTKKLPLCGISVGMTIDKEQVIGIVFIPYLNELYTAVKGQGAFLNGERIYSSKVEEPKESLFCYEIGVASRNDHLHKVIMTRLQFLIKEVLSIRCLGCPVLSLCYVASGKLDGYQCEGLYPWDVAAGSLILKEAGGYVIESSGKEFDIMKPNFLVTSTKALAEKYLEIERRADETWKE
ncbi:uncharacterized protein LOC143206699 [Rhynchophorus ferrugineus]|uniref:uncharacterized protein LOC143206699 n=1 Tax=Rhynchophorus ferrugineus TaxID=354439 RepID=UPI003FCD1E4B